MCDRGNETWSDVILDLKGSRLSVDVLYVPSGYPDARIRLVQLSRDLMRASETVEESSQYGKALMRCLRGAIHVAFGDPSNVRRVKISLYWSSPMQFDMSCSSDPNELKLSTIIIMYAA